MIKIFILTYARPDDLNKNLKSLFESYNDFSDIEVNVINNHSTVFGIDEEYRDRVIIRHQGMRANWGCGNPSRDWNQALVLGFKKLSNPNCNQIILCQDDCIWDRDWRQRLDQVHKKYSLYTCSWGDCFISILPDAVKKIGLFDERICTLGYYEGDFLIRAWLYNREYSSINDFHHERVLNPTTTVANKNHFLPGPRQKYIEHSEKIFYDKWPGIHACCWQYYLFKNPPEKSAIPNYIYYPYFEYDIEDLESKNYIITDPKCLTLPST